MYENNNNEPAGQDLKPIINENEHFIHRVVNAIVIDTIIPDQDTHNIIVFPAAEED